MELYIVGAIIASIIAIIFFKSIKILIKVLLNTLSGAVVLYLANIALSFFGLAIVIKPLTAFLTGVFGLPFVMVIVLIRIFM